ncbi:hypothetical protein K7432_006219 [Basidiobolus ranarum]|uniref:UDENN domain-containing protein n=1 Tax=Basidiobolus ranarum TaxID=34480 RepID=A0ABR2W246_9FUNG
MDLRTMPAFSLNERLILRASENKDMFEEKFVEMEEINNPDFRDPRELEQVSGDEIDEYTMRKKKRNTYIDLSSGQKKEMTTTMSNKNKDRHFFETKVIYEGHKLPIRVPLTVHPEEVGDFSLIKLITTFSQSAASYHMTHPHLHTSGPHTHPIILLINALLTQKKIIFLGHGLPSGEVANYVLAACAMGSGSGAVLRGFTERAFPYTNLTNVDELRKFPGFIAGVTNPTFEEHPKWWDVLCNIRTGKVTVSSEINMSGVGGGTLVGKEKIGSDPTTKPGSTASHPQRFENMSDSDFMSEVMLAIQSHYGENVIRAKIQEYIQRFVRLAALYEEETRGSTSIGITDLNTESANELLGNGLYFPDMGPNSSREKELLANRGRIEGWIGTISYECYQEDFQSYLKSRSITSIDVARQIMKLKVCREMSSTEAEAIFKAFLDAVITDDQVIELLANLPQNQGGLFVLASGLYHPSKAVREFTVQLFNKIKQHKAGARFIHDLNHFHKLAYERLSRTSSSTDWSLRSISNFTN